MANLCINELIFNKSLNSDELKKLKELLFDNRDMKMWDWKFKLKPLTTEEERDFRYPRYSNILEDRFYFESSWSSWGISFFEKFLEVIQKIIPKDKVKEIKYYYTEVENESFGKYLVIEKDNKLKAVSIEDDINDVKLYFGE